MTEEDLAALSKSTGHLEMSPSRLHTRWTSAGEASQPHVGFDIFGTPGDEPPKPKVVVVEVSYHSGRGRCMLMSLCFHSGSRKWRRPRTFHAFERFPRFLTQLHFLVGTQAHVLDVQSIIIFCVAIRSKHIPSCTQTITSQSPSFMSHSEKAARRAFSASSPPGPSTGSSPIAERLKRCLPEYSVASTCRPLNHRPCIFYRNGGVRSRLTWKEIGIRGRTITHACALIGSRNLIVMTPSGSFYTTDGQKYRPMILG